MFATGRAVTQGVAEEKATTDLFGWRGMFGAQLQQSEDYARS
jgi:hypothetical protein